MKKSTILTTITMIALFATTTIAFAWGNKNATGKITSLENSGSAIATVQGHTEGGYLWLGFSFKCGSGNWEDRDPKKVKGKFTETFYMQMCPQGYSAIRSCLWKGKDGEFMEGRVDCYDK